MAKEDNVDERKRIGEGKKVDHRKDVVEDSVRPGEKRRQRLTMKTTPMRSTPPRVALRAEKAPNSCPASTSGGTFCSSPSQRSLRLYSKTPPATVRVKPGSTSFKSAKSVKSSSSHKDERNSPSNALRELELSLVGKQGYTIHPYRLFMPHKNESESLIHRSQQSSSYSSGAKPGSFLVKVLPPLQFPKAVVQNRDGKSDLNSNSDWRSVSYTRPLTPIPAGILPSENSEIEFSCIPVEDTKVETYNQSLLSDIDSISSLDVQYTNENTPTRNLGVYPTLYDKRKQGGSEPILPATDKSYHSKEDKQPSIRTTDCAPATHFDRQLYDQDWDGTPTLTKGTPSSGRKRRKENTNDSFKSVKSVKWDPAIVALGPVSSAVSQKYEHAPEAPACTEPSTSRSLETNLKDFAKTLTELKKGDRKILHQILDALKNVESEDDQSDVSKGKIGKHILASLGVPSRDEDKENQLPKRNGRKYASGSRSSIFNIEPAKSRGRSNHHLSAPEDRRYKTKADATEISGPFLDFEANHSVDTKYKMKLPICSRESHPSKKVSCEDSEAAFDAPSVVEVGVNKADDKEDCKSNAGVRKLNPEATAFSDNTESSYQNGHNKSGYKADQERQPLSIPRTRPYSRERSSENTEKLSRTVKVRKYIPPALRNSNQIEKIEKTGNDPIWIKTSDLPLPSSRAGVVDSEASTNFFTRKWLESLEPRLPESHIQLLSGESSAKRQKAREDFLLKGTCFPQDVTTEIQDLWFPPAQWPANFPLIPVQVPLASVTDQQFSVPPLPYIPIAQHGYGIPPCGSSILEQTSTVRFRVKNTSPPDLEDSNDRPGRTADRLDPIWADRLLKNFMAKYPSTGKFRWAPPPPPPVQKTKAAIIQEKLERLLYQMKEKKAIEGQYESYKVRFGQWSANVSNKGDSSSSEASGATPSI